MPTNVEWGDASHSKVLGLGKVVISHDLTIEKVMLVESLAFNLLSVRLHYRATMIPHRKQTPTRDQCLVLGTHFVMGPLMLVTRVLGTQIDHSMYS